MHQAAHQLATRVISLSGETEGMISLAQTRALAAKGVKVDAERGVIFGVSVMTTGPAVGHGFEIDAQTLSTLVSAYQARPEAIKVRLSHPQYTLKDGVEVLAGRAKDFRVEGDSVRCDIHLGNFAKSSPQGNLWNYLLGIAAETPELMGMSAVARFTFEERVNQATGESLPPVARVAYLMAVDFVDDPAANRNGLLSSTQPQHAQEGAIMTKPNTAPASAAQQAALENAGGQPVPGSAGTPGTPGTAGQPAAGSASAPATALSLASGPTVGEVTETALAAERSRVTEIVALGNKFSLGTDWVNQAIKSNVTVADARKEALDKLEAKLKPVELSGTGSIAAGEDKLDTFALAATDAVCLRLGTPVEKPHAAARDFQGFTLIELGREYLRQLGIDTRGMGRSEVARSCFSRGFIARHAGERSLSMATGDFPGILANSQRKTLRRGYEQARSTWSVWASRGTTPDFKQVSRHIVGGLPTPPKVLEGQEYTYATIGEAKEVLTLAKYGQLIAFTWETMVNDDLGAINRQTLRHGDACRRLEDDLAYYPITSNQTMTEDSVALFHSSHANLAGSGAVLSVTTLGAARKAMRTQKGIKPNSATDGPILNLYPANLLVPTAIETVAEQLVASLVDPSKSNATPNLNFIRNLTVVSEPRLDANSSTAWYLTASPSQIDTVEVLFLEGEPTPMIDEQEGFSVDGRTYKIRHCCAARAIDYRGFYKNPGA